MNRLANWLSARDPGYLRLYAATRVTAAALITVGVATLFVDLVYHRWAPGVMLVAMLVTFFSLQIVTDAQPEARRRSLTLAILPVGVAVILAAFLSDSLLLQAFVLVGLLFVSFYVRRFGVRAGELMLLAVLVFFFAVRFRVDTANLQIFLMAAVVGLASALLFMFVLMPYRPLRSIRQALVAFYRRAREIVVLLAVNLERGSNPWDIDALRDGARQLRATRRVIENLATAVNAPESQLRDLMARLQLDLYNAEQAVDVMVASAGQLNTVRGELPEAIRRQLILGLQTLTESLQEHVSPASVASAAETLAWLREQFNQAGARTTIRAWVTPVLSLAAAGAQLGRAAKSTRENDPQEWRARQITAAPQANPAAPAAPNTISFAGHRLHVTTALGLQAALAAGAALLLAVALGLATPLVAFLSAFLVVSTTAGESLRRAWLRVLGTIGGVVVGLFIGALLPDNFLVVLAVSALAVFMAVYVTALSYNWMVFWITVAVMQPVSLTPGLNLDEGLVRVANIALGAGAAAFITTTVFPLRTRARFDAALAGFLGEVDRHIALFTENLLRGQMMAMDEKEYALSGSYSKLAALFPSAAYEYSPLGQKENDLAEQTTALAALHNYVTHLADEIEIRDPASEGDERLAVVTTLQTEIHDNIRVISESLNRKNARGLELKRERIKDMVDANQGGNFELSPQSAYLTMALGRLIRIRTVILEIGERRGLGTAQGVAK